MNNPVMIITGASSGIGRELARLYARRHARMILVARRHKLLEETVRMVRDEGGEAIPLVADVAVKETSEQAVWLAYDHFGTLDTVIMNAGTNQALWADDFNVEAAERVTEVNYLSVLRMVAAVLPGMLAARRGHLVAVSSLAGYRGMPGSSVYSASKAAVTTLMEGLRTELRSAGITVTTIAPGFVRTDIVADNDFFMPFLLEPEDAAKRIVRAIDAEAAEYRFPLMTSLAVRLLQILPPAIYDRLISWARSVGTEFRGGSDQATDRTPASDSGL